MTLLYTYFLRHFLFWFMVFAFSRTVFLLYNYNELSVPGTGEILAAFWYALKLDLSAACYLMAFSFILFAIQAFMPANILNRLNRWYVFLMLLVIATITCSELGLYDEWGAKLNYKALMYLQHPAEVIRTAGTGLAIGLTTLIIVQFVLWAWLYNRFVFIRYFRTGRNLAGATFFLLLTPGLLFLGLRGGWQQIPINQSESFYSGHNVLNQASVNSAWNFMHSIVDNIDNLDSNPFDYYTPEEAREVVDSLYTFPNDSSLSVLTTSRPNIVMVILESWSADLIASLGGDTGITPHFEELVKEGVLFSNIYASGARSHEGMGALLGGFPALSKTVIVSQPDKFVKLPSVSKKLKAEGYHTSYFFGGQLIYGNIKGFIYSHNYDKIIEGADFDTDIPQGKLGVHDEHLFARHLADMKNEKEPFFTTLFTLSTHAPFDMPMDEYPIDWGGEERMYLNSGYYTDRELYRYLQHARQQAWYDNTLFIIVADHSHRSQRMHPFYAPAYHKIPMLFYGNVIKPEYRGVKIAKLGSQTDLAATLLSQLGIDHTDFRWSKNLLNPHAPEFAFYAFGEGFGWIKPEGYFSYYHDGKRDFDRQIDAGFENLLKKEGHAYMQTVFQEYLDY